MKFSDHFSAVAKDYKSYRPTYPKELFNYLSTLVPKQSIVWDCGCGSGQATVDLAKYFKQIEASDPSEKQIQMAPHRENIHYHCWPAEHTQLVDHSIDLITVAQALHWFNLPQFYTEVKRVLKPKGILAAWCYERCIINETVDAALSEYNKQLDPFWPPEKKYVDYGYRDIEFPFPKIEAPKFLMTENWDVNEFLGYLSTWSARQQCIKLTKTDPLKKFSQSLKKLWTNQKHKIQWPIHLLVGANK